MLRVVPFENEAVNECWIADRDRFSYEALNGPDRLTRPMIKQGGQWSEVDWQTALEYVANGLQRVRAERGAQAIGALVSPHATVEELYLAGQLVRGLGSENIDHRLRHAEFPAFEGVRWLGLPIADLSRLEAAFVVGSNLRKDHPLFAQRVRQAVRHGARLSRLDEGATDWAMRVEQALVAEPARWAQALAEVAAAVAAEKGVAAPVPANVTNEARAVAHSLLGAGSRKTILLGNAAAHHAAASQLLALAQWIGEHTGAVVGYLTEAANTVGAQVVGAQPGPGGANAQQMLAGQLGALLLLNTEPEFDSAAGAAAVQDLESVSMVVTLSPFKANMAFSDVLLPISPFTETSGTFINAEGRIQSFHAVVKPLGETRPGWKVLRVLGSMLGLQGFGFESTQEVLAAARAPWAQGDWVDVTRLNNRTSVVPAMDAGAPPAPPVVASIYQLDSIVRSAPSLQRTADARQGREGARA